MKYSEQEVEILKEGGKRLARILRLLGEASKEGVTGKELDSLAEKLVLEGGDIPVFKNYKPEDAAYPFPATLCVSVNNVVAHGIPKDEKLKDGDVVSLDLGLRHEGLVVDSAISVLVGSEKESVRNKFKKEIELLEVTQKALEVGIKNCITSNTVNDVGIEIEKFVITRNMEVVDVLCGHAVGREVHSEPHVPHADYGRGGPKIKEGMVLAIEPHISIGSGEIYLSDKDNWSFMTSDGSKTAQFEHTILITDNEPVILTKE